MIPVAIASGLATILSATVASFTIAHLQTATGGGMDPAVITAFASGIAAILSASATVLAVMVNRKAGRAIEQNIVLEEKSQVIEEQLKEVHKTTNSMKDQLVAAARVEGEAKAKEDMRIEKLVAEHAVSTTRAEGVETGRAQVHAEQAISPPEPGGVADVRVVDVADVRVVQLGPEKDKDKDKKQP